MIHQVGAAAGLFLSPDGSRPHPVKGHFDRRFYSLVDITPYQVCHFEKMSRGNSVLVV
jgi:hypothetical protein